LAFFLGHLQINLGFYHQDKGSKIRGEVLKNVAARILTGNLRKKQGEASIVSYIKRTAMSLVEKDTMALGYTKRSKEKLAAKERKREKAREKRQAKQQG
jgi:hypothetical protein